MSRRLAAGALAIGLGWVAVAAAHPGHPDEAAGGADAPAEPYQPSEVQKQKRIERIIRRAEQRARNRAARNQDERRYLRKRLGSGLAGAPLTPEIIAELKRHARRTAFLRQISYVSAKQNDFDSVDQVDRLLAHENSRHDRWWRDVMRESKKPPSPEAPKEKP